MINIILIVFGLILAQKVIERLKHKQEIKDKCVIFNGKVVCDNPTLYSRFYYPWWRYRYPYEKTYHKFARPYRREYGRRFGRD